MTLLKVGQTVINLDSVTEIILNPTEATGSGSPVRVVYVNGQAHEFVREEADQLRERFGTPSAEPPELTGAARAPALSPRRPRRRSHLSPTRLGRIRESMTGPGDPIGPVVGGHVVHHPARVPWVISNRPRQSRPHRVPKTKPGAPEPRPSACAPEQMAMRPVDPPGRSPANS